MQFSGFLQTTSVQDINKTRGDSANVECLVKELGKRGNGSKSEVRVALSDYWAVIGC